MKVKIFFPSCVAFLATLGLLFSACSMHSVKSALEDYHFTYPDGAELFSRDNGIEKVSTSNVMHSSIIEGKILSADGRPLPGVIIFADFGNKERIQMTDSSGYYSLSSPPGGPYELTVVRSGFTTEKEVEVFVEEDRHRIVNFVMKQKKTKEIIYFAGALQPHL